MPQEGEFEVDASADQDCCEEIRAEMIKDMKRSLEMTAGNIEHLKAGLTAEQHARLINPPGLEAVQNMSCEELMASHYATQGWSFTHDMTYADAYNQCAGDKMPMGGDFTTGEPMDIAWQLLKEEDELPENMPPTLPAPNEFHSGREWPNFDKRWPKEWEASIPYVGVGEPVISPECRECKRWNRLCADCEVTRKPKSEGGWFPSTELGEPEEYPLRHDVTPEEEEIAETVRQFIIDNTLGAPEKDSPMLLEYLATSKDPHPDIHWIDDKKAWPAERILSMPQIEQLKRWAGIDEAKLGKEPWAKDIETGEPMDIAWRLLKEWDFEANPLSDPRFDYYGTDAKGRHIGVASYASSRDPSVRRTIPFYTRSGSGSKGVDDPSEGARAGDFAPFYGYDTEGGNFSGYDQAGNFTESHAGYFIKPSSTEGTGNVVMEENTETGEISQAPGKDRYGSAGRLEQLGKWLDANVDPAQFGENQWTDHHAANAWLHGQGAHMSEHAHAPVEEEPVEEEPAEEEPVEEKRNTGIPWRRAEPMDLAMRLLKGER